MFADQKKEKKAFMLKRMKIENRMKYIYGGFLKHPLEENSILFESFHGKEISDSPLAMASAFLGSDEGRGFRVFFSTDDMARDQKVIEAMSLDVQLLDIHSKAYAKALATCKYLVNNSSFPSYFIRREGQHYMQTWHGTPLKTLGKSMPYDIESMYNVQHNFLQADMHLFFPDLHHCHHHVLQRKYLHTLLHENNPSCVEAHVKASTCLLHTQLPFRDIFHATNTHG